MGSTEDLIASLTERLTPARRLPPPALRAAALIVLATALVAALAFARGPRADLAQRLGETAFLVAVGAAWLTGASATLAAFELSLPDRPRAWMLLPLPAFVPWVWGVGYGCLAHWVAIPAGAPVAQESVRCLETLTMASVPLALVLWAMLRKARPLRPAGTAWLGALAVAAFADTAHLLIHVVEATVLVLVMNLLVVGIIVAICGLAGGRSLRMTTAAP
jgi:hypothetical protein